MKTDNNKINQAIENLPDAFVYHQAVLDDHGNPLGLKHDTIPVECRILSIAVAYSAMINPRPYAETLTHEEALAEQGAQGVILGCTEISMLIKQVRFRKTSRGDFMKRREKDDFSLVKSAEDDSAVWPGKRSLEYTLIPKLQVKPKVFFSIFYEESS